MKLEERGSVALIVDDRVSSSSSSPNKNLRSSNERLMVAERAQFQRRLAGPQGSSKVRHRSGEATPNRRDPNGAA